MDRETREARQMAKNLPFKAKMAHIWTYYKWWILGTIAAVLLIGGTIYEVVTRPSYDLEIGYYSEKYVSDETLQAMESYFSQFVEDIDGDGQKTVKIYSVSASMAGESAEAQMAIQTKFMAELSAGSYPVFFFDETFYQMLQQDSYQGTMESFRDMAENPEMRQAFEIEDGTHVYWATRSLYQSEEDKEEKCAAHDLAVRMELSAFGKRAENTDEETDKK